MKRNNARDAFIKSVSKQFERERFSSGQSTVIENIRAVEGCKLQAGWSHDRVILYSYDVHMSDVGRGSMRNPLSRTYRRSFKNSDSCLYGKQGLSNMAVLSSILCSIYLVDSRRIFVSFDRRYFRLERYSRRQISLLFLFFFFFFLVFFVRTWSN